MSCEHEKQHSFDEAIRHLKEMESFFEEEKLLDTTKLGIAYFLVSDKFYKQGKHFDQALFYLSSSVKYRYLLKSNFLRLLGSICIDLKLYDENVSYLNHAETILNEDNFRFLDTVLNAQLELFSVKGFMGRKDEAVIYSKNVLDIKEKIMEEGCVGLGDANKDVAVAYVDVLDVKSALPFYLKVLEIYTKCLGCESLEVAEVKGRLAVVYCAMGGHEKGVELNREAMTVLKKIGSEDLLLMTVETEDANMLIDLGRCEEAVYILEGVVSRDDDVGGGLHAKSFFTMARTFCHWGKFADARRYMSEAQRMFEEKEMDPVLVALGIEGMASMYLMMNDFETEISLMKRALVLPRLPQRLFLDLCGGLVALISKFGEENGEVPYVEDEVEKLDVCFGPKHCVVGCGYSVLGPLYVRSGQMEEVAKFLSDAKDILDVTFGPHHLTSLRRSHSLSLCYAALGRYQQELKIEEKVIEGLNGLELSELKFLDEAVEHLSNMKARVAESPTGVFFQSKDDEDLAAKILQCGISDDGKGT